MKKKKTNFFILLILVFQAFFSSLSVFAENNQERASDIGLSVTSPITSQGKGTATISVSQSQGELPIGSKLTVKIPTNVVDNSGLDLTYATIDGFDGPTLQKVGDNFEVVYIKNDKVVAGGQTASIIWRAPLWANNNNPGTVESSIQYEDSQDPSKNVSEVVKSDTQPSAGGVLGDLRKWSMMPNEKNMAGYKDVALMNPDNVGNNVFQLPINYNRKSYSSVVVTDILPEDTHFVDPGKSAQGNLLSYNHVRVLKVASYGTGGWPNWYTNVTDNFQSAITISGRNLTVDLGSNLEDGSSYVIEYGVAPDVGQTPTSYKIKTNQAFMEATDLDGSKIQYKASHNMAIDENLNGSFEFEKIASSTEYINGSQFIDYTISVKNSKNFDIPAGTIIKDPLVQGLTYVSTDISSKNVDISPIISGNTVSWTINKKIESGESAIVNFKVAVDESIFLEGQKIENAGYLERDGAKEISTNTNVVFVYEGKIQVNKIDKDTNDFLAGAEFDVFNAENKLVDHIIIGNDGQGVSGRLQSGVYSLKETKAPQGYELSKDTYVVDLNSNASKNGIVEITIGNKKISNLTSVNGSKFWEDDNNKDNIRPTSIKVNLLADGKRVDSKIVTSDSNWKYSFNDLEKYNKLGEEIVYSVTEDNVKGYETKVEGFDITNTHHLKPTEPSTTEPSTTEPSTTEPSTTEPSTTEPSTTEPSTTEPSTTEPSTTKPSTTEPSTTEPSTTEPSTTDSKKSMVVNGNDNNKKEHLKYLPKTGESASWLITATGIVTIIGAGVFYIRRKVK